LKPHSAGSPLVAPSLGQQSPAVPVSGQASASIPASDNAVTPVSVPAREMARNHLKGGDPILRGLVVLHAIIAADGTVQKLTALSGPEMLRYSAIQAVSRWTYKPHPGRWQARPRRHPDHRRRLLIQNHTTDQTEKTGSIRMKSIWHG
jgi:hypothetical protein